MNCEVVSTGSQGNAVIVNKTILIDCGVPYKILKPYVKDIKLVLLTHIHSDHLKKATVKRLSAERPTLRFGCMAYLAAALVDYGVEKSQIDVFESRKMYGYGIANIIPFELTHNVPNCGYKVHIDGQKMMYATDTNNLNGINAYNYDLYLIEANYDDKEIQERIAEKKEAGKYAYEYDVLKNHLSRAKADAFIGANAGTKSKFIYMHEHTDRLYTEAV